MIETITYSVVSFMTPSRPRFSQAQRRLSTQLGMAPAKKAMTVELMAPKWNQLRHTNSTTALVAKATREPAPYRQSRMATGVRQRPNQCAPTSQWTGELGRSASPTGPSASGGAMPSSSLRLSALALVDAWLAPLGRPTKGSLGSCSVLRLMGSGIGGIVPSASPSRCVGVKKGRCRAIGKG